MGTEASKVEEEEVEVENMAPFLIQLIKVYTVRNDSEEYVERWVIICSGKKLDLFQDGTSDDSVRKRQQLHTTIAGIRRE